MADGRLLVAWHSKNAGLDVLRNAIDAFRKRRLPLSRVLYLVQRGRHGELPGEVGGVPLELLEMELDDPTRHAAVYEAVRACACPLLRGEVHVNVSPGTPAMHAVWLMLHAGGALPPGTRLWSSQWNPETKRARLDPVEFPVSTYMGEIRRRAVAEPGIASYEPEARSPARRAALERLARYARVPGAPLLLLGERGTGKTRLVETHVAELKGGRRVVTVPCGGLDSALAESVLFGHRKGAFTGADADRDGLLAQADGGVLFLDEVQDLPAAVQRQLVRVLQDRRRRYRRLGDDKERSVDVELVCASNLSLDALRGRLHADLFDRVSHLVVAVPPLRDCREDLREDWRQVWRELRLDADLPDEAPWNTDIERLLATHSLPGNLRDLQRLAFLLSAWGPDGDKSVDRALDEWREAAPSQGDAGAEFGEGTRKDRVMWFQGRLARWARARWGTWGEAASALGCDERTLRHDAGDR